MYCVREAGKIFLMNLKNIIINAVSFIFTLIVSVNISFAVITPVDDVQCRVMKEHKTMPDPGPDAPFSDRPPVGCDRLRNVTFRYIDFAERTQDGTVVVLDVLARNTESIFNALYAMRFPIARVTPMEGFDGDDDRAMEADNTSAFNGRRIAGSTSWSRHAYGAAIDLNPLQNPVLYPGKDGSVAVKPVAAAALYINRLDQRLGKEARPGMAEPVIDVFARNGFIRWGGYWDSPIDLQHFEIGTGAFVQRLVALSPAEGEKAFQQYVADYNQCIRKKGGKDRGRDRADCIEEMAHR